MATKTNSQFISAIAALEARLGELETRIANLVPGSDVAVESGLPPPRGSEALRVSEIRYRRLFETAKDGILILDASTGKIEDANPFMEDLLGFSQTELVGKSLWEIGLFKDIAANQKMFRELKKREYVRYEDLPLEAKTGEYRQVEFVSNIYVVDNRRVIQCNVRDISGRKEAEIEAGKIHDELVASMHELQRNDTELKSLYRLNDLLQSCNTPQEAYKVINNSANELFNDQSGCLFALHPKGQHLETVVCWGDHSFVKSTFLLDDCWALRRGQLHVVDDPRTGLICDHLNQPIQTGYMCEPLVVQGETLGLLCITSPSDEYSGQKQQQLAVLVGDSIKLSLSNLRLREKLREQALTDQLTGLGNRYYLEDNLSRELARTLRREGSVCVAMLDLDHFKEFNDTYGHDAGDMLLRRLGQLLHKSIRQSDLICRYGGEEFVIVLLDSPLNDVKQRLDKIREMVKEIEIQQDGERFGGASVSIGIAEAHGSDWTTDKLLHAADEAMYSAKRAGRDCVVVYPSAIS